MIKSLTWEFMQIFFLFFFCHRKQVGKAHMKQLQHDDDREVMRLKEMYLQDGDLYTEGAGRMRNFKVRQLKRKPT